MNTRAKNLSSHERRALTVESVVELAAKENPSKITTATIAKYMSVTQGALFRHFPNKEGIWGAVMQWVADRLFARIDKAAAEMTESSLAALQAIFLAHIEFVFKYPGVPRIMFGELQRADLTPAKKMAKTIVQHYAERLHHLIEQGKAKGELSATLDTEAAAILFIGTIQGLVMQTLTSGDFEGMRTDAPRVFAIYRRGIERTQ